MEGAPKKKSITGRKSLKQRKSTAPGGQRKSSKSSRRGSKGDRGGKDGEINDLIYLNAPNRSYPCTIEILIESLSNYITDKYPVELCVGVLYEGKLLGVSQAINVENDQVHDINFKIEMDLEKWRTYMRNLITQPLVFVLSDTSKLRDKNGIRGVRVERKRSCSQLSRDLVAEGDASDALKGEKSGRRRGSEKRGSMKRGSVKRDSAKRGSVKRGSVKRGSMKRGSVKRGSVKRSSMKRGSVKRGSMKRGSVKRGSMKSQSAKRPEGAKRSSIKVQSKLSIKGSKTSIKEEDVSMLNAIAQGNLDILPLFQGEVRIYDQVVMEIPKKLTGLDIRPYSSLPVLNVRVIDVDGFMEYCPQLKNIALITIESIFNINNLPINENSTTYATTAFPDSSHLLDSVRELELLHFQHPVIEEHIDINLRKKWFGIANYLGRTGLTTYESFINFANVKNQGSLNVDFDKLIESREPRLNWNSLRRVWMTPAQECYFRDTLIKFRCWPVEITISPSGPIPLESRITVGEKPPPPLPPPSSTLQAGETKNAVPSEPSKTSTAKQQSTGGRKKSTTGGRKSTTGRKKSTTGERKSVSGGHKKSATGNRKSEAGDRKKSTTGSRKSMIGSTTGAYKESWWTESEKAATEKYRTDLIHLVAFVDLTSLLYPGVTSTRVACQLRTFTKADGLLKWDLPEPLMGSLVKIRNLALNIPEEFKGPLPTVVPSKTEGSEEESPKPPPPEPPSYPIFDSQGRPVFIIVEFALQSPLFKKRTEEELIMSMLQLLPKREFDGRGPGGVKGQKTIHRETQDVFTDCIKHIIHFINKEYNDYLLLRDNSMTPYTYDENNFYQHLANSGGWQYIKETLKEKMAKYIVHVIGSPSPTLTESELNDYVSKLYARLMEEVHRIINSLDLQLEKFKENQPLKAAFEPNADDLLLFAIEASEQLNFPKAKEYLLQRLEGTGSRNPDFWLDYAVCALRFGDRELAMEALKELLLLDIRHKHGLLMYGILLGLDGDHDAAELFLTSCTEFHPSFIEGWTAFYVYYATKEKAELADLMFATVNKLIQESKPEFDRKMNSMLSWEEMPVYENLFLKTAAYLLKHNLFEFAELCLAQDLARTKEKSLEYNYYLAVCHYLQTRYLESNIHLEQAVKQSFQNPLLWSLIGHNYYLLNDMDTAMNAYVFAMNTPYRDDKLHLTFLRAGNFYLDQKKPVEAKKMFYKALQYRKTPLTWFGLGVACYELEEFGDSELAFTEANTLDHTFAKVWAYLALINIEKLNSEQYEQCFEEAKRYGLHDEGLLDKIRTMGKETFCPQKEPFEKLRINSIVDYSDVKPFIDQHNDPQENLMREAEENPELLCPPWNSEEQ